MINIHVGRAMRTIGPVSIIMVNFNRGQFISHAIQSILDQTYANYELIIVDDASTDHSWEIIQDYADADYRIRSFRASSNMSDQGIGTIRNYALSKARYDWVAILDSDDVRYPLSLEKQVAALSRNSALGIVASCYDEIDVNGQTQLSERPMTEWRNKIANVSPSYIRAIMNHNRWWYSGPILPSTSIVNRKLALQVGGFPESWPYSVDIYLQRNMVQHCDALVLPERLAAYRLHESRISVTKYKIGWIEPPQKITSGPLTQQAAQGQKHRALFVGCYGPYGSVIEFGSRPAMQLATEQYSGILSDFISLPRDYFTKGVPDDFSNMLGDVDSVVFVKPSLFFDINASAPHIASLVKGKRAKLVAIPVDPDDITEDFISCRFADNVAALSTWQYERFCNILSSGKVSQIRSHHRHVWSEPSFPSRLLSRVVWENPVHLTNKYIPDKLFSSLSDLGKMLEEWCGRKGIILDLFDSRNSTYEEWFQRIDAADIAIECKAIGNSHSDYLLSKPAIKILNYMRMGKPVICDATPAYVEIYNQGAGCLIPQDYDEWIASFDCLLKSPDQRIEMSEINISMAANRDLSEVVEDYLVPIGMMSVSAANKT